MLPDLLGYYLVRGGYYFLNSLLLPEAEVKSLK